MKRLIFCAGILVSLMTMATAQSTLTKTTNGKSSTAKKPDGNKVIQKDDLSNATHTFSNTSAYPAKANYNWSYNSGLNIADPTIRAFNKRVYGVDTSVSNLGIMGVPKRAYGIDHGHIIFRSSSATSSGTMTGSGSVGTGSSAGSMGMGSQAIGVNGKSPYAGPGMWGTKVAGPEIRPDKAIERTISTNKKD